MNLETRRKLTGAGKLVLGNFLMALAVNAFVVHFSFIAGGSTGMALVLEQYLHIPFDMAVYAISITCFILGLLFLGKAFALKSLASTILYPLCISATSLFKTMDLTPDPLLGALLAGALMGAGLGLILESGASSGGLDVPPLILQEKFHIPVTWSMWALDIVLLLLQAAHATALQIVLGALFIACTYYVMNHILTIGSHAVQVMLVTQKPDVIAEALLNQVHVGITEVKGTGGYTKEGVTVLMAVFARKKLALVEQTVQKSDPRAFMVISQVQQVRGTGFIPWKQLA